MTEPSPIYALDTLNRWARHRGGTTIPRRVIYAMKDKALTELHRLGLTSERFVHVDKKCNGCDGTGRYVHASGDTANNCFRCNSSGTQRLRFVETTLLLARPLVWHSPVTTNRWSGYGTVRHHEAWRLINAGRERHVDSISVPSEPAEGWTVQLPGEALTAGEAAELLCLTEAAFPLKWDTVDSWESDHQVGYYRPFYYLLDLEREGQSGRCTLCDAEPPEGGWCGAHVSDAQRRLSWTAPTCDKHTREDGFWDRLKAAGPVPEVVADPRVQRWIATHPFSEFKE